MPASLLCASYDYNSYCFDVVFGFYLAFQYDMAAALSDLFKPVFL